MRFESRINSRGSHLADIFIPNSSLKMWYARSDDISIVSAICYIYSRRSFKTILCTFTRISGVVTHFGRPLCGSSSKLSRPLLNSFVHLQQWIGRNRVSQCALKIGVNFICYYTFLYGVLYYRATFGLPTSQGSATITRHPENWRATYLLLKDYSLLCENLVALELTSGGDSEKFSCYPYILPIIVHILQHLSSELTHFCSINLRVFGKSYLVHVKIGLWSESILRNHL